MSEYKTEPRVGGYYRYGPRAVCRVIGMLYSPIRSRHIVVFERNNQAGNYEVGTRSLQRCDQWRELHESEYELYAHKSKWQREVLNASS